VKLLGPALCVASLSACGRPDVTHQVLQLEVHALSASTTLVVEAESTWLGEERRTRLRDDGEAADEAAGDGVFSAAWAGAPVRMLPVRLLVTRQDGEEIEAYAGIEVLSLDDHALRWSLELDDPPRARRVPVAASSRQVAWLELRQVGGSLLWAMGVMGVVGWLVRRSRS